MTFRRVIGTLIIGIPLTMLAAQPRSGAQTNSGLAGYTISSYRSDINVRPDATIGVTEAIAVDFSSARHGIFRNIVWRQPFGAEDKRADRYDRRYDLYNVNVSSPDAPAAVKQGREGPFEVLRIGAADRVITGPAHYRIGFDVKGALNPATEAVTLVWNAIPADFDVTKGAPEVHVTLPGEVLSLTCSAGLPGANTPCDSAKREGTNGAVFRHRSLGASEGLTITVGMPASAFTTTPQLLLEEKFSLPRRLGTDQPGVLVGSGGLLAVLLAAVAKLARRGRDAVFVGGSMDASHNDGGTAATATGYAKIAVGPPEYRPPEGLTPAELSFLITESTSTQQVTATIVDLAVRGHLRIEELGEGRHKDWRFHATPDVAAGKGDILAPYETTIITALFRGGGDQSDLSDLKDQFHTANSAAQRQIEDQAVNAHWYDRKPSYTRAMWAAAAVATMLIGGALTVVAVGATHVALLAVPIVAAGIALLAASRGMPSRTSKGSALTSRALGFKRFLEVADADMLRAAEKEGSLERHLAYASVFGIAEQWTKRLALLGAAGAVGSMGGSVMYPWWIGSGGRGFNGDDFGRSLSDFTRSAAAVLPSSPSSSGTGGGGGGGSVGSGGGGGGGGSW